VKQTSYIVLFVAGVLLLAKHVVAQSDGAEAVLVKLSDPAYPPLALQARISGDVRVALTIGDDGTIASAVVEDGHPMLAPAALESAKHSQFACQMCGASKTYSLVYTFKLVEVEECCAKPTPIPPTIKTVPQQAGITHVIASAGPPCTCDPAATIVRVRSIKCLYLWKCSTREQR